MKKIRKILTVIIVIAVVVLVIVNVVKSKFGALQNVDEAYVNDMFESYTVKRGTVESTVRGIGQITSFNIEMLSIESDEKISEIVVSEGQTVEKNQDVMKVTNGSTTRTIKAGISGKFFVVESEQDTKYCIYNLDDIGVKLSLPERDIASIQVGQEANIKVNALGKEFTGKVEYISSLPQNERYIVKIKIDYTDDIKFGYTGISSILTSKKENVISIPYDYLQMTESGKYYVYKENAKEELTNIFVYGEGNENDSVRTFIEVGDITSSDVEVLSGLEENDTIIMLKWW